MFFTSPIYGLCTFHGRPPDDDNSYEGEDVEHYVSFGPSRYSDGAH